MSKKENFEDTLPKILPPKNDIVFKMLFGDEKNVNILTEFLEAVLEKKINEVQILNPINKQNRKDDKLSILDVKAKANLENGEIIDIEMQARNVPELRSRISYYSTKMLVDQIGNGGDYTDIKPVISIIIVGETLIRESDKCHNIFLMLEKCEKFPFNDLQEIHILDLSRIEKEENETLSDWLTFINSEREEDFMRVAIKNKAINTAFGELKILSADKKQRARYDDRLKLQRDIRSFENAARQEIFSFLDSGHSLEEAKKKFLVKQ